MYFDIIGQAFKIFWQKKTFYLSVLAIQIAMLILENIYFLTKGLNPISMSIANNFDSQNYFLVSFVTTIFNVFLLWMVARFAYLFLMEDNFNLKDNIIIILQRLFRIIATNIIYAILALLGTIAFIIPGIIICFMFMFGSYGVLLDNKGIIASLKDSKRLTKGFKFDIFATLFLLLLPLLGLDFFSVALLNPVLTWVLMLAAIFIQLIYTNVLVIWYYRLVNHVTIKVEQSAMPDTEEYVEGEYRPFCPNCMKIYDESVFICPQCGINLERQ